MDELTFSALVAVVAAPAEPSDGNSIADRETFDTRTELGDCSGDFMAGRQRPRHAREAACDKVCVRAADPTRGDGQPCLIATRWPGFDIDQF
jgi:hypothetical protein